MPPKAILLVDNCTAHENLKTDDGNIIIVALPPNVTSVLQPMDQSPIRSTKMEYRKLLLQSVVAKENVPVEQSLKEHTIRDAIVLLKDAWEKIPTGLLQRAWSKIQDWDKDDYTDEDLVPLSTLTTPSDHYEQVTGDVQSLLTQIANGNEVTVQEIEEWNVDSMDSAELDDADGSDSEEEEVEVVKISHAEAIDNANKLIEWCTQNEKFGLKHTFNLMSLRSDIVAAHTTKDTKQTTLTKYFK